MNSPTLSGQFKSQPMSIYKNKNPSLHKADFAALGVFIHKNPLHRGRRSIHSGRHPTRLSRCPIHRGRLFKFIEVVVVTWRSSLIF